MNPLKGLEPLCIAFLYIDLTAENAVLEFYECNDVTYEFTATTFKKTSKLPFGGKRPDGRDFVWAQAW